MAHVSETKDGHAFKETRDALTNVSKSEPYFSYLDYGPLLTFFVTDNLKADAFSSRQSPFVRTMNAKHMIYHHRHPELGKCRLRRGGKEGAEELVAYSKLFLLNWTAQVLGPLCHLTLCRSAMIRSSTSCLDDEVSMSILIALPLQNS